MTDEDAFIRTILADPGNAAPRLVYADWLDERGDADSACRAEYLRVECELDRLRSKDRKKRPLQERLSKLREFVGDDWWRQFDYAKVEYCVEFEYKCPQRWDTLQPTDNTAVRHCQVCQQEVYYCEDTGEARQRADAGQCVAIDTRSAKVSLQLVRTRRARGMLLGKVVARVPARLPLSERGLRTDGRRSG